MQGSGNAALGGGDYDAGAGGSPGAPNQPRRDHKYRGPPGMRLEGDVFSKFLFQNTCLYTWAILPVAVWSQNVRPVNPQI